MRTADYSGKFEQRIENGDKGNGNDAERRAPEPSSAPAPQLQGSLTEQSVMRMFVESNKDRLRYNHDLKRWFIWGEHRWREDRKHRVFEMILALCRSLAKGGPPHKVRFAKYVEEAARAQVEVATENKDWDSDPWMLGTPGGVVDLRTGKLRPGKPDDMISKIVAVTPATTADCPRWLKFLDEAQNGKAENVKFFQRFNGYTLTGLTREEALLFIAGEPGTGKGTATKTILSIMRDYAIPVPSTMFTDTGWRALEYYRAQLINVRLVLASEPAKGATWNDAFVNEMTGGDMITGRNPAGTPFKFTGDFKLWVQGEQVPELKSVQTGLRRRIKIIPFETTPAEPDQNLKEALRAEYPGILRWMINGCLEWQKRGLDPPPDVRNAVDDYFAMQDRTARWIDDCCDRVSTYRTKPSALRASFNTWADRNGEDRMSFSAFAQALKHAGFKQTTIEGTNYVHGLGFKPNKPQDDPDDPWREF